MMKEKKLNKDARLSRTGTEKQCENVKTMKVCELNELLVEVITAISGDYILLVYQNDLIGESEMEINLLE